MMKRIALLICSIITLHLSAQKVSLGPELGLNVIPLESSNYGVNYQMGFHVGMQFRYEFSDHFSLISGLSLTQKKKKYEMHDTSSVFDYFGSLFQLAGIDEQEVDSLVQSFGANTDVLESTEGVVAEMLIEVPLMLNYKYKNLNLFAGPYFGWLINGNFKEETRTQIPLLNVIDISQFDSTGLASAFLPPADETTKSSDSSTDGLNKLDIGIHLGLGYQMNQLYFNLLYSKGFLDYRDEQGKNDFSSLSTFRFSLVYLMDLTQKKDNSPRLE